MNPFSRPVLTLCTALGVVVLVSLGTWQLFRLNWKTQLIADVEARLAAPPAALSLKSPPPEYTPVILSGRFVQTKPAFIAGQSDSTPGWFVVQPFEVDGQAGSKAIVLVNRGFVSQDSRQRGEEYPIPSGSVQSVALVREFPQAGGIGHLFIAPSNPEKGEFYSREKAPLSAYFHGPEVNTIADIYLEVWEADQADEIGPIPGQTRIEFSNRHFGYMLTWYGLAIGLVGVYVAVMRQPLRTDAEA